MVVDDHQMVADGLATVIGADPGVEVGRVRALGRRGAGAWPQACRPDVVVVDLRLPDVGGVELVRRLRAVVPVGCRPVLISASFTRDALDDAVAAGIDACWRRSSRPATSWCRWCGPRRRAPPTSAPT